MSTIARSSSPLSDLAAAPARFANPALLAIVVGWLGLYGPVYAEFAATVWQKEENAHAPFILAACFFITATLIRRQADGARASFLESALGFAGLFISLLIFAIGRASEAILLVSASQTGAAMSITMIFAGVRGLRFFWFPLALSFYLIVWPGWAIDLLTAPLKRLISLIVSDSLFAAGLPVAHSGAVITAGQYQLLVADACAGLNSLIALTSVGALYLYVVQRKSLAANVIVALLMAPIAILANIVRVAVLVLITYYMGYDAGQSFLHEGAGLLMFSIALICVFAVDGLVNILIRRRR